MHSPFSFRDLALVQKSPEGEAGKKRPCLSAWVVKQGVDGLAGAQSLSLKEKQEGGKERNAEGCPEYQPWVCCVIVGELPNLSESVFSSVKEGIKMVATSQNCCED